METVSFEQVPSLIGQMLKEVRQLKTAIETQTSLKTGNPSQLLSVDEVCSLLGVSRVTLWNWERAGKLEPVRFGRMKKYTQRSVDALVNKERVNHE